MSREIRAPRGTTLTCKSWPQEAAMRMLMNNLDPEVAERPQDLVVYGGTGKAARDWPSYERIVAALRVLGDDETLQPDVVGLVEAAAILVKDGFEVFAYCTEDLTVALRLRDAGCRVIMPWAAPIGSARGILNRDALRLLRSRLPDVTLVVDAGLGAPSHAADALELGYDAVLLNTAIAKASDPVGMATAFRLAVEGGRLAYESGLMGPRDFASPSTPVVGTPFWHAVS